MNVVLAALTLVLTLIGGFGLASRLLGHESPASIRVGLAWPLGTCAIAWCQLVALLLSVPVQPAVVLVPAALLCTLVRRRDVRGARPSLATTVALAALAIICIPAVKSRLGVGFVDADTLTIWARRALGYFELKHVWPDPALHPYSGYPHLVSLRILAIFAVGGPDVEPLARHASILDAASIVVLLGAWTPTRVSRLLAAAAQAGVLLAYPLVSESWTGLADLPLAVAALGCAVVVVSGGGLESRRTMFAAGLLGGVAAFTKQEGEAFAAAMAASVALWSRKRIRTLVSFSGAALLVTGPEWGYRLSFRPTWPAGCGWPDWRRAAELVSTILGSETLAALALPAAATIVVAALIARHADHVAGRRLAAAACGLAVFSVMQALAVLGSVMYLSLQISSTLDRLFSQSLAASAVILAAVGGASAPAPRETEPVHGPAVPVAHDQ
jgi:hypothetical protein